MMSWDKVGVWTQSAVTQVNQKVKTEHVTGVLFLEQVCSSRSRYVTEKIITFCDYPSSRTKCVLGGNSRHTLCWKPCVQSYNSLFTCSKPRPQHGARFCQLLYWLWFVLQFFFNWEKLQAFWVIPTHWSHTYCLCEWFWNDIISTHYTQMSTVVIYIEN